MCIRDSYSVKNSFVACRIYHLVIEARPVKIKHLNNDILHLFIPVSYTHLLVAPKLASMPYCLIFSVIDMLKLFLIQYTDVSLIIKATTVALSLIHI